MRNDLSYRWRICILNECEETNRNLSIYVPCNGQLVEKLIIPSREGISKKN